MTLRKNPIRVCTFEFCIKCQQTHFFYYCLLSRKRQIYAHGQLKCDETTLGVFEKNAKKSLIKTLIFSKFYFVVDLKFSC